LKKGFSGIKPSTRTQESPTRPTLRTYTTLQRASSTRPTKNKKGGGSGIIRLRRFGSEKMGESQQKIVSENIIT